MAENKKRPGHPYRKRADIPASQRTKGRVVWALLIAVFAVLITFFNTGDNWIALAVAGLVGAALGYYIGKTMEKEASHK